MGGTDRVRPWVDDDLADEIELYGELVVAASESDDELTLPQIDRVLGIDVRPRPAPAAHDGGPAVAAPRGPHHPDTCA